MDFFNGIGDFFGSIWGFLGDVFSGQTGSMLEIVLEIGEPIVESLMNEDLPNNIKKDNAISQIGEVIKEQSLYCGSNVADHAINLGVELLVARLKG